MNPKKSFQDLDQRVLFDKCYSLTFTGIKNDGDKSITDLSQVISETCVISNPYQINNQITITI